MMTREVLEFRRTLPPGVGYLFRERLLFNGTLKAIKIRFYLGHSLRVEVRPFIERVNGTRQNLIHMEGLLPENRTIVGDDEMRYYSVDIPLTKFEWLGHTVINRSPTATYDYSIIYEVIVNKDKS